MSGRPWPVAVHKVGLRPAVPETGDAGLSRLNAVEGFFGILKRLRLAQGLGELSS